MACTKRQASPITDKANNLKTRVITSCFLSAISCLIAACGYGQNWCGTDYFNSLLAKENPEWETGFMEHLTRIREEESASAGNKRQVLTIPVVVHVMYDDVNGNITAAQVWDGIKVLNEDFRRLNADTADTRPVFKPFAADCEFQFKLAEKDPSGNCTSGILRTNTPLSNDADNSVKGLSYWPSNKYFNVWLVNSIAGGNQNSIILGYAQFPGWGNWNTYGVVIRHDQWGRIGTSTADGRTASHELGHCLGLFHTFQDGCGSDCSTSGDNMCDTPPVDQPTYACNQSLNTCSNDQSGPSPYSSDVEDQIENYMSYDNCQNMFTKDQAT
ncbi:MAG: zinc metalloprotease, partial [Flavobacteriales bacterium]